MDKNKFVYQYSAERNREVEKIRSRYIEKEVSKLDRLKKLDSKVQGAGRIEGLTLGVTGTLIFGIGVCIMLDVLMAPVWLMPICFITGALIMTGAYPIYRKIAKNTKNKIVPRILELTDEILGVK